VKRSALVKGQRVFLRGIPGQVVDAGSDQAAVELDDGRIELVSDLQVITAESAESVQRRHAGT
jgi:preprotein translocase subunit YajC